MKIRIEYKNGILNIPASVADVLSGATRTDLALILYLAKEPSVCDGFDKSISAVAEALGTDISEIKASLSFWRGAGVISTDEGSARQKKPSPSKSIPPLSSDDIDRMAKSAPERLSLIDACADTLGRILNSSEASCLLALRDYLGVDDEYILLIAAYCAAKNKKSVKYIEKTSVSIYDKGFDSTASLEEYLLWLEAYDKLESQIRRLIGAGARDFTAKEKERIERWHKTYGFDFEVIKAAYERTVDRTGKVALPYMDKILTSWHEKGFSTVADIEAGEAVSSAPQSGSFDTDDFFSMAVKRGLGG